ncbi:DNA-processing protein DprA [Aquimarina rhabdastrellae]
MEEKLIALLALKKVPGLGDNSIKKIIRATGSAEAVFKERNEKLKKIDGIGQAKIKELKKPKYRKAAENELRFIYDEHINYSCYDESNYPERLKHCHDSPVVLFNKGNINLEKQKIISIVGTRKATSYGIQFCEQLIEEISVLNPVIVSGFAYGIDITAHKAAIKNNLQTIGCLAHGLNQIYPKAHAAYVNEVLSNGGFFTDFWSTDVFDRKNFLGRNRIIAGLSEATIVIESAEKGGSLVTAQMANSYHREVFAVPGRNTDSMSKGCNTLIKTQQAHLLTSVSDLIYILNWDITKDKKPKQQELFVSLTEKEQVVYDFLKTNGKELLDVIAIQCKIPTYSLATLLLNMELKGVVQPLPGKIFEAI